MTTSATATRKSAPSGSYRSALQVREFDGILLAFLVSVLGDSAAYLAVTVLVYERTHSSLLAALTFAAAFAPYLLGGTLLSALVDRVRPRRLLVGLDLLASGLVCVLTVDAAPICWLFAVLVAVGILSPVRSGASAALTAEILSPEAFVAGRSALRVCAQTAQILGIAVGGGLVAAIGPRAALAADAVSFVLSGGIIAAAVTSRPPRSTAAGAGSVVGDSLRGLTTIWAIPRLRRLLLVNWLLPFVVVAPEGLAAPAVAQAGGSPGTVGLWLAVLPVGLVVGDLAAVWFVPPGRRAGLLLPLGFALPALLVLFAANPPLPVCLAVLFGVGLTSADGLAVDQRLRTVTPPALLGRALTVSSTGLMVVQGLGFAAAGALGEVLSAHLAIAVLGGLALVGLAVMAPALHRDAAREP